MKTKILTIMLVGAVSLGSVSCGKGGKVSATAVVQKMVEALPSVQAFVVSMDAVVQTIPNMSPDDKAMAAAISGKVTNGLTVLDQLGNAYLQKPDATVFQQITNEMDVLVTETDATLQNVLGVNDPTTRTDLVIALGLVDSGLHVADSILASAQTPAQLAARPKLQRANLKAMRQTIKLQPMAPTHNSNGPGAPTSKILGSCIDNPAAEELTCYTSDVNIPALTAKLQNDGSYRFAATR